MKTIQSILISATLIVPVTAGVSANTEPAPPTIPSSYHGEWRAKLTDCGSTKDAPVLIITDRRIGHEVEAGTVVKVKRLKKGGIQVFANWGEMEPYAANPEHGEILRLSRAGQKLTTIDVKSNRAKHWWSCSTQKKS